MLREWENANIVIGRRTRLKQMQVSQQTTRTNCLQVNFNPRQQTICDCCPNGKLFLWMPIRGETTATRTKSLWKHRWQKIIWSRAISSNTSAKIVKCQMHGNKQLVTSCPWITNISKLCETLWSERRTCARILNESQATTSFRGCSVACS